MKNYIIKFLKWTFTALLGLIFSVFVYFEINEIPIYNLKVAYKFITGVSDYKQYEGLAEKLGYLESDKLLIIHADDIGLSKSVNDASFEALKNGLVNSGSIMMTCNYISDVGEFAIENPEIDLGLHLTVTSEWRDYKWDGVSSSSSIPSLIDKKGHLFENKKKFTWNANPGDLKRELQAQINLAKSLGINPTHIDSHEGALFFDQKIFKAYLEVGEENKLPVFVPKPVAVHFDKSFPKPKNVVIVDNMYMALPDLEFSKWDEYYINVLNNLGPGLNEIIVHLGYDDKEMQNITVDHPNYGSKWRNLDLDVISSQEFRKAIEDNNIKLVTWREIQNIIY
jgi:predicted glycoside hydrolase/deacetylase ChbG (UPF0249 family)